MSRDVSGTYTLVAGNPVVSGTTITAAWANNSLTDIATALTDSLSRTGLGGMTAPLKSTDGAVGAPQYTWTNEPTSGWYRKAAGSFWFSVLGADIFGFTATGLKLPLLTAKGSIIAASAAQTLAEVTVGANGKVLTADSTAAAGVSWTSISGGFQPLTAAVAANALTFTLAAGATLNFNDGTTTTLAAPITLVVPNTALMGTIAATPNRLWVVAMKNAGTPELAARNNLLGTTILGIDLGGTITSTLMDTGADLAQVWYSTTARATQAFCIVGYIESTQAVAGVWATAPSKQQGFGPGVFLPGQEVQSQRNTTGAVASGSTQVPYDDTIPQNTEGDQYLSQAITPSSAANVLSLETQLPLSASATGTLIASLYQDTTANALASNAVFGGSGGGSPQCIRVLHKMLAGTSISTTIKARAGLGAAGTTTMNGLGGARELGGVSNAFLEVKELMI